jgi:hypothetical protein
MPPSHRTWRPCAIAAVFLATLTGAWFVTRLGREHRTVVVRARDIDLLGRAVALSQARLALKLEMAEEMVEGRLSLRGAVARLREHFDGEPALPGVRSGRELAASLPGRSEEEKLALHLYIWVKCKVHLEPRPAWLEALAELGQELREMIGVAEPESPPRAGLSIRAAHRSRPPHRPR